MFLDIKLNYNLFVKLDITYTVIMKSKVHTVQYTSLEYSVVQYSIAEYSTVQYSTLHTLQ